MQPWSRPLQGRFEEHVVVSEALRGNPLGDPHERPLWVYLPPGYDDEPDRRYPTLYQIQGLTGQLDMWRNRAAFRPTVPELVDELFAGGGAPPCLVVWVDAWTSLGGSQFLDSPGTGRYHTYLCDEVVPWVDARYRTLAAPAHRGIAGKSSGGYGAMVTPMLRPDLFGGLATHAGDALFEVCYLPDFRASVRALRDQYGGSFDAFWADFRSRPAFAKESDALLLNDWCMAACYSADPDGTVRLPYDPATGSWCRRSGSDGWPGTRSGWCPATPTRCAACGRSTSTPARATRRTSTSAPRPSGGRSPPSGSPTCASSCSRRATRDRVPLPARPAATWPSAWRRDGKDSYRSSGFPSHRFLTHALLYGRRARFRKVPRAIRGDEESAGNRVELGSVHDVAPSSGGRMTC